MQLEEAKKNLYEIIKLCEEELKNNDDNVSAILDLEDLKSLQTVLQALDNSIPKQVVEIQIERVKEERLNLKSRTDLKHEILMQEDCKLLGEQKAYKKLLEGK